MSEHGGWGSPAPAPADPWAPTPIAADPWAPHHDVLSSGHAERAPRRRGGRRVAVVAALTAIALVLAAGAWAWFDRARQTDELLAAISASEQTMVNGQESLSLLAADFDDRRLTTPTDELPALEEEAALALASTAATAEAKMRERIEAVEALDFRPWNTQAADTRALYLTHQAAWAAFFAAAGTSEVTPEIQAEISRSWDAFTAELVDLGYDDDSRAAIAVIIGPSGDGQGVDQGGDPNTIQA
jgi:hypothetical protein